MSAKPALFKPLRVGELNLQHRIAMAPLTRFRADDNHVHSDIAVEYYKQRAQVPGTLLITEATFIAPQAGGYSNVPGCYNSAQSAAWKRIVDAVHAQGSYIYLQLWALGRAADPKELAKDGLDVVSASDVPFEGGATPRPLSKEEIKQFVGYYADAAKRFVEEAGGDGVEIHGANGYLIDQFTQTVSNKRTDDYGGSVENRIRFALEVTDAVTKAVGPSKVGIRLSPYSPFQGMKMEFDDIQSTFGTLVTALRNHHPELSYIHVVDSRIAGNADVETEKRETIDFLHSIWKPKPFLLAGGMDPNHAKQSADKFENSVAVFGRYFISNPDIVKRIEKDVELTAYDRHTFYSKGPEASRGYIDYPNSHL